jgi:hypothetical protein
MKTLEDYQNDPRITGDLELMRGPDEIREIHAIRLKIWDERLGMTEEEFNRQAEASLAELGVPLCYGLEGQGRVPSPTLASGK